MNMFRRIDINLAVTLAFMLGGCSFHSASLSSAFVTPTSSSSRRGRLLQLSSTTSSKSKPSTSASTASRTSRTLKSTNTNTPLPKYPTLRGTEVDSRKIVARCKQFLTAVRLRHILLATEPLALETLHQLRAAAVSFQDVARQVSACTATRDSGGSIGWVSVREEEDPDTTTHVSTTGSVSPSDTTPSEPGTFKKNEHLDGIFPAEAREKLVQITTKPGDVVLVESSLGFHLVQVVDVMADVKRMAQRRFRPNKKKRQGILSGALLGPKQQQGGGENDEAYELTYKLETMGCQMNQADSERIEGQIQSLGIRRYEDVVQNNNSNSKKKQQPDVVVLNTCSIRDHAEQKVYSYIGPYAKRKRAGEDVTIVVAGCVAQQEGEALLRRAPEVDLVMGPQYANRLGDLLEDVANGNQVVATEASHIMEDSTKPRRQSTVAAWVNVIYGCNERCTFCIVPTTRGVEQSRPVESIQREVEELVQQQNYKEVTLLGQNCDAWGRDMLPKKKFSDLIRTVGAIEGLERLRFVTSHPRYMSLGVVDAVTETAAACEAFHIPFQSGSNRILAAMGRGHTREKYLHICNRIRSRIPDAAITADVIVGFPGETEEDFEETLQLMKQVVFSSVNTAAYSPRPNTPAATMTNQISEKVKKERLARINRLNAEHAAICRSRLLGQEVEILVEERNVQVPTQVMGRTRHGYIVYCEGDIDELRGKLVNVQIDRAETYYLAGSRVDK